MRPTDPALTAALAAGERSASTTARLGGHNFRPQIASWKLDRGYGTDLPSALRAFSGTSAAQLDAVITGTGGQPAPALYGPWAPRSTGDAVRPGQSVVHGWGLGSTTLDTFRGTVRSRSASHGADTVSVAALDGAERLRMPARLPRPAGGIDTATPFGPATNWVASPTWCVDHLIRGAGIHTCPPPRGDALLYASLHGGAAANIGYLKDLSGDWSQWTKTGAPWECAVEGALNGQTRATYTPRTRSTNGNLHGGGFLYEIWIDNLGARGDQTMDMGVSWTHTLGSVVYTNMTIDFRGKLTFSAGANSVPANNPSVAWTYSDLNRHGGRWHIALWLTFTPEWYPKIEGAITFPTGQVININPGWITSTTVGIATMADISVRLGGGMRAEALQLSSRLSKPATPAEYTQAGNWTKTASLDAPDTPVRVIPVVTGTAWEAITSIANASLSTAEFDADGIFRWRGRRRWEVQPTAPDLTVTTRREIASLTTREEIDACRNVCSVKWQHWWRVTANKTSRKWATLIRRIDPLTSYTIWWYIADDELDTPPPPTTRTVGAEGIRFTTENSETAPTISGLVDVSTERRDGKLFLTMYNRGSQAVWLRGENGGPSVSIVTPTVEGTPSDFWSTYYHAQSQERYGVQAYMHDPEGWVQDAVSAESLAASLLSAGALPAPLLADMEILADPRIELGDVVRVIDSFGAELDTLAWVVGIKTSGDSDGVRQILTLRGTASNGLPVDAGLTPDPPVKPGALLST
ncbi:hypothetical protein AB0G74_12700 [Streptomyces sp. NPDC020875]|uniref:hypothetical protein n=1 Tax=Streptomyces sp. NPDC020875 TaxID=3154898 RepID=UPI0033DB3184